MTRFGKTRAQRARARGGESSPAAPPFRLEAASHKDAPFSGEIMDLNIEAVAPGGRALAHAPDGRVVFVDLGVPGQKVRAEIIRSKGGYLEARRREVLCPAAEQEAPFCPYFGICGGCIWQEMPYARQLETKRAHILESLARLGGVRGEALEELTAPVLPSPEQRHFRGKVELAFGPGPERPSGGKKGALSGAAAPLLGFRHLGGHAVVDIAACPIADARLPELLDAVRSWAGESKLRAYTPATGGPAGNQAGVQPRDISEVLRFLVVRTSRLSGRAAVELITAPALQAARRVRDLGETLLARLPWVESFTHSLRRADSDIAYGEEIVLSLGAPYLKEGMGGLSYELSPASFFQTNPAAAQALVGEAVRLLAPQARETIWDLYAGVGAFSLPLAARGARVTGLEANPAAVADARRNAEANSLENCLFVAGDVRALLCKPPAAVQARPDAVLADPPRAGLHPDVSAALVRLRPGRILLVSCHLATLARDLGVLSKAYELRAVQGVDMFPYSAHVETLCLLTLRG